MTDSRRFGMKTYGRQTQTNCNVDLPWHVFINKSDSFEKLLSNCKRYKHPSNDDEPISSGPGSSSSPSFADSFNSAEREPEVKVIATNYKTKKKEIRGNIGAIRIKQKAVLFEDSSTSEEFNESNGKTGKKVHKRKRVHEDLRKCLGQENQNPHLKVENDVPKHLGPRRLRTKDVNIVQPKNNDPSLKCETTNIDLNASKFQNLKSSKPVSIRRKKEDHTLEVKRLKSNRCVTELTSGQEIGKLHQNKTLRVKLTNVDHLIKERTDSIKTGTTVDSSAEFQKAVGSRKKIKKIDLKDVIEMENAKCKSLSGKSPTVSEISGKVSVGVEEPEPHQKCSIGLLTMAESSNVKRSMFMHSSSVSDNISALTLSRDVKVLKVDRIFTKNSPNVLWSSEANSVGLATSTPMNDKVLIGRRSTDNIASCFPRCMLNRKSDNVATTLSPIFNASAAGVKDNAVSVRSSRSSRKARQSYNRLSKQGSSYQLSLISGSLEDDLLPILEESVGSELKQPNSTAKTFHETVSASKGLERVIVLANSSGTNNAVFSGEETNLSLMFVDGLPSCSSENSQTFKKEILRFCNQETILTFDGIFPKRLSSLTTNKIAEGSYSEVFKLTISGKKVVIKIVPVGGVMPKSMESQMTFEDILSEMAIAKSLSLLREKQHNSCSSFINLGQMHFVRGRYPHPFVRAWKSYADEWPTANENPGQLSKQQLYVIFRFEDGGSDLEHFTITNPMQVLSIIRQVSCSLAVAEQALEFEHRDLHCGNVLVSLTKCSTITYVIDGDSVHIETFGVEVRLIDYTLSRMRYNNVNIYTNLTDKEELFNGIGDPQYDVYRDMRKINENNWAEYHPVTNVLWIKHILEKFMGQITVSKRAAIGNVKEELLRYSKILNNCLSSHEFVLNALK